MHSVKKAGGRLERIKTPLIAILVFTVLGIATIYAAAAYTSTVTIKVDGVENQITTLRTDANEILRQAGVEIEENDIVDLSNFEGGADSTIVVKKAYTITIYDNGKAGVQYRANGTVAEALEQNGIVLKDGDEMSASPEDLIYEGQEIVIARGFPVKITADGETVTVRLAGGCVSDALDKAVLTLDDDDKISVSLDTLLKKDMKIKITRISYEERTEKVAIKFKTEKKNTDKLYVGQSKVEKKGVKGEKLVTYKDKVVDGKIKESKEIKSVVTKQPVNEVKLVGTKKKPASAVNTAGGKLANGVRTISRLTPPSSLKLNGTVPTSYKRKIVGTASAYSGGGVTATGRGVMPGYIAVNPRQIPYHTKMWIVSNDGRYVYGYASAEDTGGFINWTGSRATLCDLYMASESQASAFGRRSVTIYVL